MSAKHPTRRRFVVASVASAMVATLITPISASGATEADGDYFTYPSAAVVQSLGEIPNGVCDASEPLGCDGSSPGANLLSLPGLGIPLGGVGSGSFIMNQSGTFGPWHFGGNQYGDRYQNRILPQAAFHVREQLEGDGATVKTLATEGPSNVGANGSVASRSWGDPLSGWDLLNTGDADYAALYPFGWMSYSAFDTDISMRFYSPIVPDDDKLTSLPLAHFDVRIANTTDKTADVSTMFTMPNVAQSVDGPVATTRTGLTNSVHTDTTSGITSVTMASDAPSNTPDAYKSEWTIAAKTDVGQTVSYVPSWNAEGDGTDIYDEFSDTGVLDNEPLDESQSAGAIAVSVTLAPGEATVIPFALTWDFPQVTTAKTSRVDGVTVTNTSIWMRRYTEFYGARMTDETNASAGDYNRYIEGSYPFNQSRTIAEDALVNKDANLAAVQSWWTPLVANEEVPTILRTASLNQLAQVAFKSSIWAAGFVSSTGEPTLGHRLGSETPGTRIFVSPDSIAGGNRQMGVDTGSYGYLAYNRFFPSIERDVLTATAEGIMVDPSGNPEAPYIENPYVEWVPGSSPVWGSSTFVDVPVKRIARFYAYSTLQSDAEFLEKVYPAMKKQMAWVQGMIEPGGIFPIGSQLSSPNGANLPLAMPNSYNIIPVKGADAYNSMLYLLSLEIMIESGTQLGEHADTIDRWKEQLAEAKVAFDDTFWDEDNQWYRYTEYDDNGSAVLLDTFFAQHVAEQLDLPDLIDLAHYRTQLTGTYGTFMSQRDLDGDLVGAHNLALPDGETVYPLIGRIFGNPVTPLQEIQIWTGANYFVGGTYINAGQRFGDPELVAQGVEMASAVAEQIWGKLENGFAFNAPEAWESSYVGGDGQLVVRDGVETYTYAGYERPMAVWEAYDALDSIFAVTPLDQTALVEAIAEADGLSPATYTVSSWSRAENALVTARAVLDDSLATQRQVNAATQALVNAIATLAERGDPTALQNAVDAADAMSDSLGGFTEATVSVFTSALAAAKETLAVADDKTQAQLDAVASTLQAAIRGLTAKPVDSVNKAVLQSLYDSAVEMSNSGNTYTVATWADLQAAITAAKRVLDSTSATQAQVDAAATSLAEAVEGLRVMDEGPVKEEPDQTQPGLSGGDGGEDGAAAGKTSANRLPNTGVGVVLLAVLSAVLLTAGAAGASSIRHRRTS